MPKDKKIQVSKLNWSTDYQSFKLLDFNRDIDETRVLKLKESIERNGFLVPVLVNQNMFVVDGQHRLAAAELAESRLSFLMYTIDDIMLPKMVSTLNSTAKTWGLPDYHRLWCKQGRESYIWLDRLALEYRKDINILYRLIYRSSSIHPNDIRSGGMVIAQETRDILTTKLSWVDEILESEKAFEDFNASFHTALIYVVTNRNYTQRTHKQMKEAIKANGAKLLRSTTVNGYLDQIESAYNRGKGKTTHIKFSQR